LGWTDPSVAPPAGNVPPPVNVGDTAQIKEGRLGVAISGIDPSYGLTIGSGLKISSTGTQLSLYVEDEAADPTPFIIDASGNVGIGTTSPSNKLHLSDTGVTELIIEADTDNATETDHAKLTLRQDGGAVVGFLGYYGGTNQLLLKNEYNDALQLGANNTVRMTITPSGNVGIGTTEPSAKLEVAGDLEIERLENRDGLNFFDGCVPGSFIREIQANGNVVCESKFSLPSCSSGDYLQFDGANWVCSGTGPCTPDCSCAAVTCIGSTCSDGCGGTCAGTLVCGSCPGYDECTPGGSGYGSPCSVDENCASCNCYDGYCQSNTYGSYCTDDGDCVSNNCYDGYCQNNTYGSYCTDDGDCASCNCYDGYCQSNTYGSYCTDDWNCASNNCYDGYCQ